MADTSAPQGGSSLVGFLDRYFGLTENGTSVRTEFVAGVTTFLTMVYIVIVNPQILGNAGMDKGAVFVATCLAGFITYALCKILAGRFAEAKPAVVILAALFAVKFAML